MCKYYVFPAVSPVCTAAPRHVLYTRVYFEVHDKPVNADKDSEFCDDEHSEQVNIFEAYRMSKPPFLVGDRGFHDACPGCEREKNGKKLEVFCNDEIPHSIRSVWESDTSDEDGDDSNDSGSSDGEERFEVVDVYPEDEYVDIGQELDDSYFF
ncbi:hypothetical protein MPDQ_007493 [Monascus purpureus]|uniref:Uncharacterized protein n=1 Tax=Monascus purpureus TaxID=5098 RepID=A0A507R593_MONPU|nr:hypothetical protein MPDQ_007493 [Monascus purpureus]